LNHEATGVTVTGTPYRDGKFLIVRRSLEDQNLPGYWAFPGGRVHFEYTVTTRADGTEKVSAVTETLTQAIAREILEETSLRSTGRMFYVDSYPLGERAAAHFCVEVASGNVVLEPQELIDYRWISDVDDMAELAPRIPGLDNHLTYILAELNEKYVGPFRPTEVLDLVPSRYLNR
jgi:8-oxo-dGTP pyrophosphatase MutT (NUDIX family)